MIKERTALAMYEVKDLLKSLKETEKSKQVSEYLEKFMNLESVKSKKLRQEIEGLGIIKLRESDVIKIVDLLPENSTELNKIFAEISLDADETNKILNAIKNNK